MPITLKKLLRFQTIRNKSGFASNMQFHFDAQEAGLRVGDFGEAKRFQLDGGTGYLWEVRLTGPEDDGVQRMAEWMGRIFLEGEAKPKGYAADHLPEPASLFKWIDEHATWPGPTPEPQA